MLIVAGYLWAAAESRADYLQIASAASVLPRATPGCLDFAQSADPLQPDRVLIYERWEFESALLAFRPAEPGPQAAELPPVVGADVARYEISSVGPA